jgi:uncharacterized protein YutE (UPF0331/DUF86 family)
MGRPRRKDGAAGSGRRGGGGKPRSKNQRRLNTVLEDIPMRREQLLVAMEEFPPDFSLEAFVASGTSGDARERNTTAVVEHEFEILVNALHELAEGALAEGQRLNVVKRVEGRAWERLAALGVISSGMAADLQNLKELRNELAHHYPPESWALLHEAVETLLTHLDHYLDRFEAWGQAEGILVLDPG